jgi:hypothetical protein
VTDELPPVTADQLRALRELRFVTVNRARTRVIAMDKDKARVEAVGFGATTYQRAPGVWDCEMTCTHPQIIAALERMLGLEHG